MRREAALMLLAVGSSVQAASVMINEFTPNPPGNGDPTNFIELAGTPGYELDGLFLLFIDSDGGGSALGELNNLIDLQGLELDSNGLLSINQDFENPSFTIVLADDDLDTTTDIDETDFASVNVLDAVGISDQTGDDTNLFASELGFTDFVYPGNILPEASGTESHVAFRDSVSGLWYQGSNDFSTIVDASGNAPTAPFNFTGPSNGSTNPTLIPSPAASLAGGLGLVMLAGRRRRKA